MNWHRKATIVLLLAIAVFAASCASSARLGRISPLVSDSSRDRVNLWPFVYHSGQGTAVLWPLFDVDDKGFALRPLAAKDGSKWELLYPWATYNSRTKNGWAIPFYSLGENSGLFPVANFGKFSYVGLVWWKRDAGGTLKSGGLFPLAYFGDTKYLGPIWWSSSSGGFFPLAYFGDTKYVGPVWWTSGGGGLFPLMKFGDFNYVGPLWWSNSSHTFGIFPLFGTGSPRFIGPVWWNKNSSGVFPLVWSSDGGRKLTVFPFYSHDLQEDSRKRNFLLGLGHTRESTDGRESWALPLYYSRESPGKADTVLFPLFWKHTRGERSKLYSLLGNRSVDPKHKSLNVYPLWWSSESASSSRKMLLPFFYSGVHGDERTLLTPLWWSRKTKDSSWNMLPPLFYFEAKGDERTLLTPLGGRGWSASGATRYFNVLGPIYHHSRSMDGSEERTAVLWPFFERHRDGDETTTRAAPFFSRTSSPDGTESWYGLGLGHYQRSPSGSSHRLWPLYHVSDEERVPGFFYDVTLYGQRTQRGTTSRHLFPLFASDSSADRSSAWYGLGLGHFQRTPSGSSHRFWPLYSASNEEQTPGFFYDVTLYGQRSRDGKTSRHLFPLFSSVSSAERAESWYGLGLGHYRRTSSGTSHRFWPLYSVVDDAHEPGLLDSTSLYGQSSRGGTTERRLFPLFASESSAERTAGWYGLGLGHFQFSSSGSSHRFWPLYSVSDEEQAPGAFYKGTLYGQRSHAGTTERHLFPLFWSESSPTGSDASFLFWLGGYSKTKDETSWRLWPLVAHSENEGDSAFTQWTTLFGDASWPGHASLHVGGPLIYTSTVDEAGGFKTRKHRLLTFLTDEQQDATDSVVPTGTRSTPENLVHRSRQAFLFGVFKREHCEYRVWREGAVSDEEDLVLSAFSTRSGAAARSPRIEAQAKEILAAHDRAPELESSQALKQAVVAFADASSDVVQQDEVRLPLVFDYESDGRKTEWNGPLWLIRSKNEPEHSKLSVLYFGYRTETQGEETRRDIFPFVTWDTSPQSVNVSFMWRLFHYRRDGEKSSGHLLFIPWGDA